MQQGGETAAWETLDSFLHQRGRKLLDGAFDPADDVILFAHQRSSRLAHHLHSRDRPRHPASHGGGPGMETVAARL